MHQGARLKILLVDDEPETRRVLQLVLRSRGYMVKTARNGADGLRLLENDSEYALVLTDFFMPGMDGFEFSQTIRRRWIDLPIILMTACGSKEALMGAWDCPCDGFIEKPFDIAVFLAEIERVLLDASRPWKSIQES